MKESKVFDAIAAHDQKLIPKELLDKFKALCEYQAVHNPYKTLQAGFNRLKDTEHITFGQAATVAPFMVDPRSQQ